MTPPQFKRAMELLFGVAWVSPAAELLSIRHNKLQRMATGTERIYPDTGERIRGCLEAKKQEIALLLQSIDEAAAVAACPDCRKLGCCNKHLPF